MIGDLCLDLLSEGDIVGLGKYIEPTAATYIN
jgi:hypothetical protein